MDENRAARFKILIVEDSAEERRALGRALRIEDFEVTECEDSRQAHALCLERQPDLVLLDVVMPYLSGIEVLQRLRSDPLTAGITVVAISGVTNTETTQAMLAAGARDYWTKPINLTAFLHWLHQMINVKLLKKKLQESEARWSRILDLATDGVMMIDIEQHILLFSASAERLFGYSAQEVVGQSLSVLLPDSSQARHIHLVRMFADTERDRQRMSPFRDVYGRRKDGSIFPIEVSIGKMEDGEQLTLVAMMRDITERKRAEQALRASEERYRSLFESTSDAVFFIDLNGQYMTVNQQAAQMLGYSSEELLQLTVADVVAPEERPAAEQAIQRLASGESLPLYERFFRKKDGSLLPVEVNAALVRNEQGEASFIQAIVRDISERQQAQQALRQANEQLTQGIRALQVRSRQMTLLSKMSEYLQSCQSSEEAYAVIANYLQEFFPQAGGALSIVHPSQKWLETVKSWGGNLPGVSVFNSDECWALRRSRLHRGGLAEHNPPCGHLTQAMPAAYLCVPLFAQSDVLGVLHLYEHEPERQPVEQQLAQTLADSIALSLANLTLRETLRSQSIRDGLTGLYNRRHMEESLERELHRFSRSGHPVSLIMLDLDHFKHFNDTYGHNAGDGLLKALAALIQNRTRAQDIPCRYGGEEFLLILPDTGLQAALQKAELLRQEAAAIRLSNESLGLGQITISCGVASSEKHGLERDALIKAADEALYQAKHNGRNRVEAAE